MIFPPICGNDKCVNRTEFFKNGKPRKYCCKQCGYDQTAREYRRRMGQTPRSERREDYNYFMARSVVFLRDHGIAMTHIATTFKVSKQRIHEVTRLSDRGELFT